MSKLNMASKVLLGPALAVAIILVGCNENMHHNNDEYGYYQNERSRTIFVKVCAHTTYTIDVYIDNVYETSVLPNRSCVLPPINLYDYEIVTIKIVVYKPNIGREVEHIWYFDNSQTRYGIEVYDGWSRPF